VILNVEEDHLDCYKDLAAIQESFTIFARRVPNDGLVLVNALDARCRAIAKELTCRVQTFGVTETADWEATNLALESGYHACDVRHNGQTLGRVRLGLPGRHNVDNALAVAALAAD